MAEKTKTAIAVFDLDASHPISCCRTGRPDAKSPRPAACGSAAWLRVLFCQVQRQQHEPEKPTPPRNPLMGGLGLERPLLVHRPRPIRGLCPSQWLRAVQRLFSMQGRLFLHGVIPFDLATRLISPVLGRCRILVVRSGFGGWRAGWRRSRRLLTILYNWNRNRAVHSSSRCSIDPNLDLFRLIHVLVRNDVAHVDFSLGVFPLVNIASMRICSNAQQAGSHSFPSHQRHLFLLSVRFVRHTSSVYMPFDQKFPSPAHVQLRPEPARMHRQRIRP